MAICQVPQAVLIWRTGNTKGISVMMQTILTLGIAMWFVTGILLNNVPMYVSNGFCLVFCVYFNPQEKRNAHDTVSFLVWIKGLPEPDLKQ